MKVRLFLASKNKHKLIEMLAVIRECGLEGVIEILPSNLPKVEIQSDDLKEIALYAAQELTKRGFKNFLLEDAGLFIPALGGFPGPYSSFVYRTIGCRGILKLLEGVEDRRAYFLSVIAANIEGDIIVVEGRVNGRISLVERGTGGFGFDPIFIPEGSDRTFAEMSLEEKNMFSHRARAMRALLEEIRRRFIS